MNRRSFGVALTLSCLYLCSTLAGCEWLHQGLRPKDKYVDPDVKTASTENVESEGNKILDVQSDAKKQQPFFRSSRLPGGLSSEAREIERDMGIH